jgi:hypothetical protein
MDLVKTGLIKRDTNDNKFRFESEENKSEKKNFDYSTQKKNILYYAFKDIRER